MRHITKRVVEQLKKLPAPDVSVVKPTEENVEASLLEAGQKAHARLSGLRSGPALLGIAKL